MVRKFVATAVMALVLFPATIASASQWVLVGQSADSSVLVDVDSIKGTGDTRTFWSQFVHDEDKIVPGSVYLRYRSVKSLEVVDCSTQQIGTIRAVFYNSNGRTVDSIDVSNLPVPRSLKEVVPDSIGEAALNYVCGLRTDAGSSRQLGQSEAVSVIKQWFQAKKDIFAPPFSPSRIEEVTTGTLRNDLLGSSSPIAWLKNNNAYYRYGTQSIDSVNNFSSSSNQAVIEVSLTEEKVLYINGEVDPNHSKTSALNVRYFLEFSGGKWKVSDYRELN